MQAARFVDCDSSAPAGLMARRASYRLQGGLPVSQPSMGDPFGDVLLTPTFTSQEIAMLIEVGVQVRNLE